MSSAETRFATLYRAYFRDVHAYCRRRTSPDRADDVAAEVFLLAWKKLEQAPEQTDALPWLFGIAYGVVSNAWRGASRQRRLRRRLDTLGLEPVVRPDEVTVMRQEARQILEALSALRRRDQEVLRLSIWEELDNSQIAAALGVSVDTAKQRLSRARKRLADQYNRQYSKPKTLPAAQKGGAW